jgi:ribonuclease P protein component
VPRRTGPFGRADRLLRSREFEHVARKGERVSAPGFVVCVSGRSAEPGQAPRLGLTVSRRVGGAVVRNRVKRRLREWFRRERAHLPPGLELVVIARASCAGLSSDDLRAQMEGALRRLGAWAE